VQVEIDIQVALGIYLVRRRVTAGFVAEEVGERLVDRNCQLGFIFPFVFRCHLLTRRPRVGNGLLTHVRRIADYNIKAILSTLEDFHKGNVPDEGHLLGGTESFLRSPNLSQFRSKALNLFLIFWGLKVNLMRFLLNSAIQPDSAL
jgi:hypothetical protein